jgi:hypothetical protein
VFSNRRQSAHLRPFAGLLGEWPKTDPLLPFLLGSGTERMRQKRAFLKVASNASVRPDAPHSSKQLNGANRRKRFFKIDAGSSSRWGTRIFLVVPLSLLTSKDRMAITWSLQSADCHSAAVAKPTGDLNSFR